MGLLGISFYAIGIVVFLGSAAVYLRGSRDKGTIASLERQNSAFSEEITGLHADVTRLNARVTYLEGENKRLESLRPSAEAIKDVATRLQQHDLDIKALLGRQSV